MQLHLTVDSDESHASFNSIQITTHSCLMHHASPNSAHSSGQECCVSCHHQNHLPEEQDVVSAVLICHTFPTKQLLKQGFQ